MENADLIRELQKVSDVLGNVAEYLKAQNEANAKLHMSSNVMYSPLTSAAALSHRDLTWLIMRLYDEQETKNDSKEEGPTGLQDKSAGS